MPKNGVPPKPLAVRFWGKVDRRGADDCWLWTAHRDARGYGSIGYHNLSRTERAHRVSWELHNGPIPEGIFVCHRCDNPPCVNPSHLFLGTASDNWEDCKAKGRDAGFGHGGNNYGAKLSASDVRLIRSRYAEGRIRKAVLGRLFGVTTSTVSGIVNNKTWTELEYHPAKEKDDIPYRRHSQFSAEVNSYVDGSLVSVPPSDTMNEESIVELLKEKQGDRSQRQFAEQLGISPSYLCDVYKGNRQPTGKILEFLGIERKVLFEFKRKRA